MDAISKNNRTYFMGIAIILVILHHFCLRLDTCWHVGTFPFSQFYWGQIGVDIFFFLSAYGCCASYEHNKYLKYIWHRIYRIYPMYTFFLLIVLSFFFTDSSIIHRFKLAIFSLIGIAPIYKLGVYIEWYIPSLILMYLLLPFVFIICKKVNKWGGSISFNDNDTSLFIKRKCSLLSIYG